MAEQKLTVEESFRKALEDVIEISSKLSSACESTAELVEVAQLALTNDGQLKLLLKEVAQGRR